MLGELMNIPTNTLIDMLYTSSPEKSLSVPAMLRKSNRFNASCNVEATSNAGAFKLLTREGVQSGFG